MMYFQMHQRIFFRIVALFTRLNPLWNFLLFYSFFFLIFFPFMATLIIFQREIGSSSFRNKLGGNCKVFLRIPNSSFTIFISCLNNQLSRVLSLKRKKGRKRSSGNVMFDSLIKFCYVDEEASTVGVYCINIT